MNTNRYGKDIRLDAFGTVFAEVWRDEGDWNISIQRKTFGKTFLPFLNNEQENFKEAHAWADEKILLLQQNETSVKIKPENPATPQP